ncbi:MAG TPA: hypothetical protein VH413_07970 [Verrucomicrobiae bacterium]|jgi:hypothetical protein|nr:hypothetical protein [Verrucomicrobiae bacterium]
MRKQIWAVLFVAMILGVASAMAAPTGDGRPPDEDIRKKIVGEWHADITKTNFSAHASDKFEAEGKYSSTAELEIGVRHVTISVEGKWEVKDGMLKETITKSSNPEYPPIGLVTNDKVVRIDDKEFVYQDDRNEMVTCKRVK